MKLYRFCCMDSGGRISQSFYLSCAGDLEAVAEAESVADANGVEVWDGGRLVARVGTGDRRLD